MWFPPRITPAIDNCDRTATLSGRKNINKVWFFVCL